ncbi:MAG: anaerobic glycerol-3-phosphate dehydrogenase subunit C [Bacteroidetes bacterium]|jgi:Fe-S oxidoreductase|nr:anaerobic glycerol-3-phosphate dehydrogenase subunit C [Bacteroidota bacterium]MCL5034186.1 anaerobic glycerol-3-phosphate dehydrogenase subunit C [Bacteroidota bacterium]
MAFDFNAADFYDTQSYAKETARIFDICNGCRLCFNLCPSFDVLFKRIDELDGDMDKLTDKDTKKVVDLCYDCKLCFPKCPYTPPHQYMLDFPRHMLRGKAIEAKKHGVTLQDKMLSNTDLLGTVSTKAAPIVNWSMEIKPFRILMEKTIGIHRERNLPKYSSQTFHAWYEKHKRSDARISPPDVERTGHSTDEKPKVVFFHTCSVNYNDVDTGKAAIQVLEKNGVHVEVPPQKCCGMPYLDGGDVDNAKKHAAYNLSQLAEYVKKGYDVVSPGPSCSYLMKQEYPMLSKDPDAKLVASHTFDLMEYLAKLNKERKLSTDFKESQGNITYHLPCHLKAQNIGFKSRDVLQLIPETNVEVVAKCSGHDGTWSLKKENFKMSLEVGKPLFDKFTDGAAAASDCPLAQLQIEKGSGTKPRHPIQILRDAYGLEQDPKE